MKKSKHFYFKHFDEWREVGIPVKTKHESNGDNKIFICRPERYVNVLCMLNFIFTEKTRLNCSFYKNWFFSTETSHQS